MTPAPEILPSITELTPSIILRDQAWEDYHYMRANHICSRCGDYSRYEIIETQLPTQRDLNEYYGYNFYTIEYKIQVTRILNKNSLSAGDWGNLCHKCKNHILGIAMHDLSSSKEGIESKIRELKTNERKRQSYQDEDIKKARAKFNKERRENNTTNGGKPASKEYVKLNPNDKNNNQHQK
jgi:hypothetical protein